MAEHKSSTPLAETTPKERQQRLGQVYGLLITLARQKRAEQQRSDQPARGARDMG